MRYKAVLMFFGIIWLKYSLISAEMSCVNNETILVGWLDSQEVYISEEAFYIQTNSGLVELKVLEYDEEGKRYLVECIKYGDYYYPTPENSF